MKIDGLFDKEDIKIDEISIKKIKELENINIKKDIKE